MQTKRDESYLKLTFNHVKTKIQKLVKRNNNSNTMNVTERKYLRYESNYSIKDIARLIKKENYYGLSIGITAWSKYPPSTDFLEQLTFLKGFGMSPAGNAKNIDFSFLKELPNLESLQLIFSLYHNNITNIDLSNQINLKSLSVYWDGDAYVGIEKCVNLDRFFIQEVKDRDFTKLPLIANLSDFDVISSKIKSLDGISKYQNLTKFRVGGCRSLNDISDIANLKKLKDVEIVFCQRLKELTPLLKIENLEKLTISQCKHLNNFDFLFDMPNLKEVVIHHCGEIFFTKDTTQLFKKLDFRIWGNTKIREEQ